ncbi:MAG: MptD family putative ECF transporter S component [Treponema sp.]|jgi:energy-coupling factor transport system substrate-specific component|nr:MptD family putative ECF transporter S component [Treponema sp.]
MEKQTGKLTTKDFIIAGAFAALYAALFFALATGMGFVPIVYIFTPFVLSIVLGPVYMLYVTKISKPWAIMILAAVVGLLTSMDGFWICLIWSLALGLAAEFIARRGRSSGKKLVLSFMVFACTNMGPAWILLLAKQRFLDACIRYYGEDYASTLDSLTPRWIIFVFLAMSVVGGLIGGILGSRILKKHFEKAGIV